MANLTLLDLAKLQYNDPVVGLIEEALAAAPELSVFPARTVPGTSYKTLVRTALPTVGFTKANAGSTPTKSTLEQRLTELFILRGICQIDKAIAMQSDGLGMANLEMIEASGVVEASLRKLGKQIWYGQSSTGDTAGFAGLKDFTPKSDATKCVDAGGTTSSTGSSVYFVKFGVQAASLVFGNGTTLALSPFRDQQIVDPNDSTKWLAGRVADLTAWSGLQIGNANVAVRICNLTDDSGKGLTDALLAKALALFKVGYQPDAIFMSRRSRRQLQVSRTVTLFGQGATKPSGGLATVAPLPDSYDNLPIYATDQILDTDTLE